MPRKNDAERKVARVRSCAQRIVDGRQLDEPGPPVGGRRGSAVGAESEPARYPLEAGGSGEPDGGPLIAQDDKAVGEVRRCNAQAQAKPCRVFAEDEMVILAVAVIGERLKAGR